MTQIRPKIKPFGGGIHMSVLSDGDIQLYLAEKKLSIEPFDPKKLTPNGYDVTIEEVTIPKIGKHVVEDKVKVPSMAWFAVGTEEYLKLSSEISGQIWIRTSYARRGVMSSFGKIDAGFEGNLTLSAFNASHEPIELEIGKTFAQVVFETLRTEAILPYERRSGNYMGQKGVTLSK